MDCVSDYMIYKVVQTKFKKKLCIYGKYIKNNIYFCLQYGDNKCRLYMNRKIKTKYPGILDIDFFKKYSNYMNIDSYYHIHYYLLTHL